MSQDDLLDPTGVPGLDQVLRGGLPAGQLYLLEGAAGAGKTTLGLQFLLEGARRGETVLWCTLAETESQLRSTARSHGWDLSGVNVVNLADGQAAGGLLESEYSFFSPGDVELDDVTRAIIQVADSIRPRRVVFDPFSDVRLLARDPLRFRRQLLELRAHFAGMGATVLLVQESGLGHTGDAASEGVVHGVLTLYQHAPDYGKPRRRLRIHKLRGRYYREGFHDVAIRTGGLEVYPRLSAGEHELPEERELVTSEIEGLDRMLGGGIDRGASMLVMGPSGVGKSTVCSLYADAAARRGERSVLYLFDESRRALLSRTDGLGVDLRGHVEAGLVDIVQVNPAEFSPGEFSKLVRDQVEGRDARIVVIDSLNGYMSGMPDERHLAMHMHELLTYLTVRNVVTLLPLNQQGMLGEAQSSPVDVTYLADAAVLLRYFESDGQVRRAVSVVKRRCGAHEAAIRGMTIAPPGIQIGEDLQGYSGVLTGQPDWHGGARSPARAG